MFLLVTRKKIEYQGHTIRHVITNKINKKFHCENVEKHLDIQRLFKYNMNRKKKPKKLIYYLLIDGILKYIYSRW